MTERVFTEEELERMGKRTVDLLDEAIEMGDQEQARELARRMYREFSAMHHRYVDWVAGLMDYVYTQCGDDALFEALRQVIGASLGQMADVRSVDFRRRVQALAASLRGHLEPIRVTEDDEKVCIAMEPCGSGQRLMERGSYQPPLNLTMLQKPHPITWGMTDFPIYCTHAPMLEILSIEQLGYPATVAFPPEKVASERSCTYCIYKNVEDIPEEVYTRVGKQKPGQPKAGPDT
jgi:hypothetical protein